MFFWIFVGLFFLHEIWETALGLLNASFMKKSPIPAYFRDKIGNDERDKSVHYHLEKFRFDLVLRWLEAGLTWSVLLLGGFGILDVWLRERFGLEGMTLSIAYGITVALILFFLRIPVSAYSQFVIEERFGFNKTTRRTFVRDLVKSLFLGALLGIPLLLLIFWLYDKAGRSWWLWAFFAVFSIELFIAAVFPTLLAPIFNKFTPLPDGPLKEAILDLAQKIRFNLFGIYTIDGSRRSSHSNAYFAGMGRMRRIVLFDTLLSQLSQPEIVAVLAHEMGHNKKRHIQKQMVFSLFTTLAGFWVLSLLVTWWPFYEVFRAGPPAPHKALVLFGLFAGVFSFWMTPLMNYLSRKYEYQADQFSAETTGDRKAMASALVKLSKENLSNLTPHPLYSFYHYSHPTTLERIRALGLSGMG